MNKIYEVILKEYGFDEPVFTKDLKNHLNISDEALRQNVKRLSDKGDLIKVRNGIYYVPRAGSVFKNPRVNIDKVIRRRYIKPINKNVIGYISGTNFANQLGLTLQTASVTTIVTNETGRPEHKVTFGKKEVKLKKPRIKINDQNYKLLQILDLLSEYDRVSEIPLKNSIGFIKKYLQGSTVTISELNQYIKKYPRKALENSIEMELYNEFARK
ncbi:type IV toxin-antitoxin system AbiEi family antitoxin domain-containing protein [Paraliobacillus sp. X-1268]|uniref:type IV toxin-antitoxin system AbiEi family antitoxin domain-containing protein n=1 Tax=Paraliobacillus sp. X-1268 TaxID=2213193 RepID=UPI000E3C1F5A|nr:type IV toxin-antitoxin system AbiEi family antitoxin domain-containing protein [Paraliobacillus sp. X-1268]